MNHNSQCQQSKIKPLSQKVFFLFFFFYTVLFNSELRDYLQDSESMQSHMHFYMKSLIFF